MGDALTLRSDEGRGMAAISYGELPSKRYIRRFPNGETHRGKPTVSCVIVGTGGVPGEVKHLSTRRKRDQ